MLGRIRPPNEEGQLQPHAQLSLPSFDSDFCVFLHPQRRDPLHHFTRYYCYPLFAYGLSLLWLVHHNLVVGCVWWCKPLSISPVSRSRTLGCKWTHALRFDLTPLDWDCVCFVLVAVAISSNTSSASTLLPPNALNLPWRQPSLRRATLSRQCSRVCDTSETKLHVRERGQLLSHEQVRALKIEGKIARRSRGSRRDTQHGRTSGPGGQQFQRLCTRITWDGEWSEMLMLSSGSQAL